MAHNVAANLYASNLPLTGFGLWFGATNLTNFCAAHLPLLAGKSILELGCGATGYVGLAIALLLDADAIDVAAGAAGHGTADEDSKDFDGEVPPVVVSSRVVITDGEPELMSLLDANCSANGYTSAFNTVVGAERPGAAQVKCAKLWWGDSDDMASVATLAAQIPLQTQQYDVILGADLVYSTEQVMNNCVAVVLCSVCYLSLDVARSWRRHQCRSLRCLRRWTPCSHPRGGSILRYATRVQRLVYKVQSGL